MTSWLLTLTYASRVRATICTGFPCGTLDKVLLGVNRVVTLLRRVSRGDVSPTPRKSSGNNRCSVRTFVDPFLFCDTYPFDINHFKYHLLHIGVGVNGDGEAKKEPH